MEKALLITVDLGKRGEWTAEERQSLRDAVPRQALGAMIRGRSVQDIGRDALAIARRGLDARGRQGCKGKTEAAFLDPLDEIAHFLGGHSANGERRPVRIIDAGVRKELDLQVVVPVDDMGALGQVVSNIRSGPASEALQPVRSSIWPSIYPRILAQVLEHRSTIIFCNARRQAERLAARLNELAAQEGIVDEAGTPIELVKSHHGSLAREQRVVIEDELKRGELRAIVATSSLELGIDMGAVDLVIQVESPGAVSRGLQRVGRAGHSVGEPSKGTVYPKHRGDLLEAAVVTRRMREGLIESSRFLRNPLDVLAQQIVAHVSMFPDCSVEDIARLVRGAGCFGGLSDDLLRNVLDLLSGRYPSDEFSELRPRLVWDRTSTGGGSLRARDGAKRLAVANGGTIPDRGLFGVFLPDGTRVGELDEEMVYESRTGETFLLGASTWRIEDITFERVIVTPAPGQPGKMPFWHGDRPGRPLELGRALGEFVDGHEHVGAEPRFGRAAGRLPAQGRRGRGRYLGCDDATRGRRGAAGPSEGRGTRRGAGGVAAGDGPRRCGGCCAAGGESLGRDGEHVEHVTHRRARDACPERGLQGVERKCGHGKSWIPGSAASQFTRSTFLSRILSPASVGTR